MKVRRVAPIALALSSIGVLSVLLTAPSWALTAATPTTEQAYPASASSCDSEHGWGTCTSTPTYTKTPTKPPHSTKPPTSPPPTTPPPTSAPPTSPPPTSPTETTPPQTTAAPATLPVTGTSEWVLVAVAFALIVGGWAVLGLLRLMRKDVDRG